MRTSEVCLLIGLLIIKLTAVKQSTRSQQCGTSGQTFGSFSWPCRTLGRARRELGWAQSTCRLSRRRQPCKDKLLGLWLPDSSNHPKPQLFPLFCCSFGDPIAVQWWALSFEDDCNRAALKRLCKLQVMSMDPSPEETASCAREDHRAFSFLGTGRALRSLHLATSLPANTCLKAVLRKRMSLSFLGLPGCAWRKMSQP